MKITKRQLRRIIREATGDQLPYSMGGPWVDKGAPVGTGAKEYDYLDRELTDEEIEASAGWDPADPSGDGEFWRGYQDGAKRASFPQDASDDYAAGYEDGIADHGHSHPLREANYAVGITKRQLRRIIRETAEEAAPFGSGMEQADLDKEEKELVGHT